MNRLLNRDGEIHYREDFLEAGEAERRFRDLLAGLDWHDECLRLAGRRVQVPRRVCWYGDAGAVYRYASVVHEPQAWTDTLADLRARVETALGRPFNSVLGNLYRNGQDAMGWHADAETELGACPVIASLSLGAERRFEIRHRHTRERLRMELAPGSLLVMSGPFQEHWQHRVPRQPALAAPRINLTFRLIIQTAR